jgi:hypothetical protein
MNDLKEAFVQNQTSFCSCFCGIFFFPPLKFFKLGAAVLMLSFATEAN